MNWEQVGDIPHNALIGFVFPRPIITNACVLNYDNILTYPTMSCLLWLAHQHTNCMSSDNAMHNIIAHVTMSMPEQVETQTHDKIVMCKIKFICTKLYTYCIGNNRNVQ